VLAPSEEKSDDSENSVYEELLHVCDHFRKCHKNILLREKKKKVGRENILKPTIGNESLHQDSNDNGLRIGKFVTPKNLVLRALLHPPKKQR
jgi:hypothetical protein